MYHTYRCCLLTFTILFLATYSGCSGGPGYKVVPFEGTITYKGQPLENVNLDFAVENYRTSGALVLAGGKFKAVHSPSKLGVPVGKCILRIGKSSIDAQYPPEYQELFAKYGRESAGYVFDVKKAEKDFKIDLE